VSLKPDAVPTIFDYEDRTAKPSTESAVSRKRKHDESSSPVPWKGRKILEVIDFNSLLDDYLKGLQAEEELNSSDVKKGPDDELFSEIIPGSSPCEGGDKFVLLLNKQLPEDVDEIKSSLLCVRFGSGHVVPVKLWKDHIIRGEYIPRSDKPGVVTVQLETNDGRVLGSTKFVYKEEICTGFKKIVSSTNYRGKLLQAFCNKETKKTLVSNSQTETHSDESSTPPSETSLALASILRLMLYIAAKNEVVDFVEVLYRTDSIGKAVMKSFTKKEQQEDETSTPSSLQQGLTVFLENISTRLTTEEEALKAKEPPTAVKVEEGKKPKPDKKEGLEKKPKPKQVKTKQPKKLSKTKQTSTKKPVCANAVFSEGSQDMSSKTNSLLLLSDIAIKHLSSEAFENGTLKDVSLHVTQSTSSAPKKEKKSYQSRNALKFSRKILLLPSGCTRLPRQGELLKIKTNCAENENSVQLENNMTASEVLQQVRTVLSTLGKKRIRLAAADAKGQLDFFKGTKWAGKTVRQRIKFNSVLYVVPW